MRIGPFGQWEIIIILVVVVLLFGGKRLPEMAKGLGQSIREFRAGMRGSADETEATQSGASTDGAPDATASRANEPS